MLFLLHILFYLRHVRAKALCAVGRLCPKDRVFDNRLYLFLMEGREGLVAGLEIEYPAVSAVEASARAENLTALIGGNKHGFIRLGNVKRLTVGLQKALKKGRKNFATDGR